MTHPLTRRRLAAPICAVGLLALAAPTVVAAQSADGTADSLAAPKHKVIKAGLDNPRQLALTPGGKVLVAQAGHGSYNPDNCIGEGEEQQCVGLTGRVSMLIGKRKFAVIPRQLSASGPDGSFATGSNGAGKRAGGAFYTVISDAPPEFFPEGIPGRTAGTLIARKPGGKARIVADLGRYEERKNPDGEVVESNPYSVLPLRKSVLVADAAGDSILSVSNKGRIKLFHLMKEYGPRIDAVPTSLARDKKTGNILVGELHSEIPNKARVWALNKKGKAVRSWKGFSSVTGVARTKDGTLYVSELFGGTCGFDQIPSCFPGQVTRVKPNGKRKSVAVPFPAGVVVKRGKVHVAAFSISPATGFGGNPDWSGQIWQLF